MALGLGKAATKAIFKAVSKNAANEVLPVIGKEVAEQTFKNLDVTARGALEVVGRNDSFKNLALESQDAFIKHIESLPVKDIPPEAEAIDSMFKKMDSTDPEIQNIGLGEFNEVDQGLRGVNNSRREAERLQAKMDEVRGKPPLPTPESRFTVSKGNLAPGIEGADLASEVAETTEIHRGFKAFQQSGKKLGESQLSTGSTIGSLGQKKSFNLSALEKAETVPRAVVTGEGLGTKIIKKPGSRGGRLEPMAEIENMPYKELHHIFGKAPGEKIISNVWKLIDEGKATVEDLLNLNHWAKHYSVGLGDFGAEAVNRVPHSRTHSRSRAFKREMTAKEIKEIPEFDNMDDLTSYFRETLETRTIPMRGELDIQQGIYDLLPQKMRLDVEKLKVAKEQASRDLTQTYKDIYGEKMPDTPPEVKDAYQTHIWIQKYLDVTDDRLIELAEKLDQARLAQDMQMTKVVTQLEKLEAEELASLDRKAIKTGRPGKQTSARAQQKIDYSQVRDETDPYEMLTGNESMWGN